MLIVLSCELGVTGAGHHALSPDGQAEARSMELGGPEPVRGVEGRWGRLAVPLGAFLLAKPHPTLLAESTREASDAIQGQQYCGLGGGR